jgi:hypothetical protein
MSLARSKSGFDDWLMVILLILKVADRQVFVGPWECCFMERFFFPRAEQNSWVTHAF